LITLFFSGLRFLRIAYVQKLPLMFNYLNMLAAG